MALQGLGKRGRREARETHLEDRWSSDGGNDDNDAESVREEGRALGHPRGLRSGVGWFFFLRYASGWVQGHAVSWITFRKIKRLLPRESQPIAKPAT